MQLRLAEFRLGTIRSVDGAQIIVKADLLQVRNDDHDLHVEVGSFINCGGFHGDTICIVTRVYIEEVEKQNTTQINKIVELSIVGSIDEARKFTRGIDHLPPISCDVFLLNGNQINFLLGIPEGSNKFFKVGKRSMRGAGDVYLDLDKLLGRHLAIVGTTGSGKSSTLSAITQSILRSYNKPRMIFFDIHNEYSNAFSDDWENKAKCIKWNEFNLPYWFLDLDEFIEVFYSDAGGTQKTFIKDSIEELKRELIHIDEIKKKISVDSPVYFDIEKLIEKLDQKKMSEIPSARGTWEKIITKIKSMTSDPRFNFLMRGSETRLPLDEYFNWLLGMELQSETYVTVLDLSGLPSEVRTITVGILARLCFDYRYWDLDPENLPMALILEEAHTYIPEESESKYSLCLERIEKIAKEGRKYGLSLIVVTQRPSNVSSTVLSQCGTFISLRLTSDLDQNKIKRLLPDTIGDQASVLSSLRDREGLISGDAITLPGKVMFDEPNPWPKSDDVKFHVAWTRGKPDDYSIKDVVSYWNIRDKTKRGALESENQTT
jgi:energy-coupling factor transporter ATP-binding protein EcfA2